MRYLLFGLGLVLLLGMVGQVEAQSIRGEVREDRAESVKDAREQIREVNKERKEVLDSQREGLKAKLMEDRKNVKDLISSQREVLKERREDDRKTLRERLGSKIADERKVEVAVRISEKMAEVNKRLADNMLKVVNRLEVALARLEVRAGIAEVNGINTEEIKEAINLARGEVEAVRLMVADQSGKFYRVEVNSEATAREEIKTIRDEMRFDLNNLREQIMKAKESVRLVLEKLKAIDNIDELSS